MRKQFVECETRKEALEECPWASAIRKAVGGYWCFESHDDAKVWDSQK